MVSKASDDFPEPEIPVMMTNWSRGISTSMFLRLCSRAPLTTILSMRHVLGRPILPHSAAHDVVGERQRGTKTVGARDAAPGDVVGDTVVCRGPHDGEPEGDIH